MPCFFMKKRGCQTSEQSRWQTRLIYQQRDAMHTPITKLHYVFFIILYFYRFRAFLSKRRKIPCLLSTKK